MPLWVGHVTDRRERYAQSFSDAFCWNGRSQWPCALRRGCAATRLLGLWVGIPPGVCKLSLVSISVFCQVEVSATSWSPVQKSPTDCGASLWVI